MLPLPKGWEVEQRSCLVLLATKGRREEVFLLICHSVIKMANHCGYIMDYCPRKEAFAGVSNTGRVKRNQHVVNQHTTQWAGSGGKRRQKASGVTPLLPPFIICCVCLDIKKLSCKDEVKTNYSRELTTVVCSTIGSRYIISLFILPWYLPLSH